MAVLWKYGGWYVDTDVIFLRSLSTLSENTVAWESADYVNNAILGFAARHLFLAAAMNWIRVNYDPHARSIAGPLCYTAIVKKWKYTNCVGDNCVFVGDRRLFYPYFWPVEESSQLFAPYDARNYTARTNGSYGIHLWNAVTTRFPIEPNSVIKTVYEANCIVCANIK